MPLREPFHCVALEVPAPTVIPPGGRFVVVEEEVALGSDAPGKKQLYWQNASRVVHPVPEDFDCVACGCWPPVRMSSKAVSQLPSGLNFTCSMIIGVPDRVLLLAAPGDSSSPYKWLMAGLVMLLVGALLLFFVLPKKQKTTRGVNFEDVEVAPPASSGLLKAYSPVSQPIWIAPPRYLATFISRPASWFRREPSAVPMEPLAVPREPVAVPREPLSGLMSPISGLMSPMSPMSPPMQGQLAARVQWDQYNFQS